MTKRQPPRYTSVADMLSKHSRPGSGGCVLWTGWIERNGYGRANEPCRPRGAGQFVESVHRMSYRAHRGEIPPGMCVLHKCDVRNCINPDHLFLGTIDDNNKDKARKGRAFGPGLGEKHWRSSLNDPQVRNIRVLYNYGVPIVDIAKMVGISYGHTQQITSRLSWKHIEV